MREKPLRVSIVILRSQQEREKCHLADFLKDYDDERDDQQFYKYAINRLIIFNGLITRPHPLPVPAATGVVFSTGVAMRER